LSKARGGRCMHAAPPRAARTPLQRWRAPAQDARTHRAWRGARGAVARPPTPAEVALHEGTTNERAKHLRQLSSDARQRARVHHAGRRAQRGARRAAAARPWGDGPLAGAAPRALARAPARAIKATPCAVPSAAAHAAPPPPLRRQRTRAGAHLAPSAWQARRVPPARARRP
jgi:hypothetical protein